MEWWSWIAVGAVLLGWELTFVDAQFYLVFVGASAFVVGMLQLTGLSMPVWLQWLIFAALSVSSLVIFRKRIYDRMRRQLPPLKGGPAGEIVTLPADLPPGESCRLEFRGCSWSALNGGKAPIAPGAKG